jgi:hypothetical protein
MTTKEYKAGDLVKIRRFGERFWCKIEEIKYGTIIARVDNNLLNQYIKYNDTIYFLPEEIVADYIRN